MILDFKNFPPEKLFQHLLSKTLFHFKTPVREGWKNLDVRSYPSWKPFLMKNLPLFGGMKIPRKVFGTRCQVKLLLSISERHSQLTVEIVHNLWSLFLFQTCCGKSGSGTVFAYGNESCCVLSSVLFFPTGCKMG